MKRTSPFWRFVSIAARSPCFSIAGHYVGSGLAIKNGSKVVRPVILCVLALLMIRVVTELL